MKKSFLIILLVVIILPLNANASSKICDREEYNKLKQIAYNVNISYELVIDETTEYGYYFKIFVSNLTEDIKIKHLTKFYTYDEESENKSKTDINLRLGGGLSYEFLIYGTSKTWCIDEYVGVKRITLPTYNLYFTHKECIGYEEFSLCKKWYSGDINSETDFLKRLEEYKKSLEKKEEIKENNRKNSSIIDKIINFYTENIYYTLPITVVVLLSSGFVIFRIRKIRKNRIKLDI